MKNNVVISLCLLCFSYTGYSQTCTPMGNETSYGTNNVWIGYAYDNMDLTSYKGYVNEGAAASPNFDEGFGGDDVTYNTNGCSLATSTFSMRYKLTKTFATGNYIFTVGGDDGYRFSLDGGATWAINNWGDHGYTTSTYTVALNSTCNLVLEYYENGGGNRVTFDCTLTCMGTENTAIYGTNNIWNGYIYDGTNFDIYAGLVHEGSAANLNFDESFGGSNVLYPTSACSVQTETFSARYRLTKTFAAGTYIFTVGGDDGYRLSIDGGATWLVNKWSDQSYVTTLSPVVTLNGTYNMVLEFYENGGENRVSIMAQTLTILPINLTSFTATPKYNEVVLNWGLAAGSTPKQFEIERSVDGIHFTTILTQPANTTLQYSTTDNTATTGTWYYRLKITDSNGGIYYSTIQVVNIGVGQVGNRAIFYPSIVSSNTVMFKSATNISNAIITTIDINGRVMLQQSLAKISAGVPVNLSVAAPNATLQGGLYIIKVTGSNGELLTGKVIVQ